MGVVIVAPEDTMTQDTEEDRDERPLGDRLAGRFAGLSIDSVEEQRNVRDPSR